MTNILELNKKYPNGELASTEGDNELRYKLFSPLFINLYENKVVYHERFTCIIQLSDIELTPERFYAKARLHLVIKPAPRRHKPLPETWEISANWSFLSLDEGCLSMYSGWIIWPDPLLVESVEKLVLENKLDEAYNLTMGKK